MKKINLLLCLCLCQLPLRGQEDLSVLNYWNYHKAQPHLLYHLQMETATAQLKKRQTVVAGLKTRADWSARQQTVKKLLQEFAGNFPEKTPLNPVVTGVIERDGVKVEKLYFESRPGYFVTAALFLPAGAAGRLPALVYCSGHSANGFRSEAYQKIILNYAKKGFAVLAFDPIGQGERIQYFREDGKPRFGATHEHSYPGSLSFVAGRSPAHYFIWDGIRAVDYLLTRKEVDPARIGIAGRSGGGTQSAYIAAFDERIVAAAPECYLTTFDKLLRSKGPQDAEQVFMHALSKGFDLADLVEVRAPKPALMVTTTNDIFSIEGARQLFGEARKAYSAFGKPDNLQMVEDDAGHASTRKNREASYAFFRKHLANPGNNTDEEVAFFTEEELYVTPGGKVYETLKGETLFSLNNDYLKKYGRSSTSEQEPAGLPGKVAGVTGYKTPEAIREILFSGRIVRDAYMIEKYLVRGTGDYLLPLLWMKPAGKAAGTLLLFDERGKAAAAAKGETAEALVAKGYEVVLPDLNGVGELKAAALPGGDAEIDGVALNLWYMSILTNRSLAGIRMEEITLLTDFVRKKSGSGKPVSVVATGVLCSEVLQAAAVQNNLFYKKVLIRPLVSFRSVTETEGYRTRFLPSIPAGALTAYDLPQLAAAQPAGSLLLVTPVDGGDKVLGSAQEYPLKSGAPALVTGKDISAADLVNRVLDFLK